MKGKRKRSKPVAKRLLLRVKQTLCRLENDKLRITIDGKGKYAYIYLSKRHFKLPDNVSSTGIGEPIITADKVYLPVHVEEEPKPEQSIAWDSNFLSLDGYSPETGWIK